MSSDSSKGPHTMEEDTANQVLTEWVLSEMLLQQQAMEKVDWMFLRMEHLSRDCELKAHVQCRVFGDTLRFGTITFVDLRLGHFVIKILYPDGTVKWGKAPFAHVEQACHQKGRNKMENPGEARGPGVPYATETRGMSSGDPEGLRVKGGSGMLGDPSDTPLIQDTNPPGIESRGWAGQAV